jgi:hypothetical protein
LRGPRYFCWTSCRVALIMPPVGSTNVYLLPVLSCFGSGRPFSRPSWRASMFGPFRFSPESETRG